MPGIFEYNRKEREFVANSLAPSRKVQVLTSGHILGTFLYRITLQLPVRIAAMLLGIAGSFFAICWCVAWMITTTIAGVPNYPKGLAGSMWFLIVWAWQWKKTPHELHDHWQSWKEGS